MEPVLGAKVTEVKTNGVASHALGQKAEVNGVIYQYVRATAALTAGLVYYIGKDFTVGVGAQMSTAIPAAALGVPQVAWAAPSGVTYNYGWVAVGGTGFSVKCDANCPADVILALGSTTGVLASSVAGLHQIAGLRAGTAVGGSAALTDVTAADTIFVGAKIRAGGTAS